MEENLEAKEFYEILSYSGKRKYVNLINSEKKAETREKRITEAILKLKDKIKLWLYHSFIFIVRNYDDF